MAINEYGETYAFRGDEESLMGHNAGPEFEDETEEPEEDRGEDALETEEVESWLHARISSSLDTDEVSRERQESLDYYLGRPYGDELAGYSSVVTRDVFELVEWALASMVRIFLSAPRIVEFKPASAQDMEQAKLETEVVHSYMNGAFIELMSWIRDAFLYPNAYLKVWHDEVPRSEEHTYRDLTQAQVGMLEQDEEVELLWVEEGNPMTMGAGPMGPQPHQMPTYTLGIKRTTYKGKLNLAAVPPEEIIVLTEYPTSLSLNDLDYVHAREVTKSELVEMGYDIEWVRDLPAAALHHTRDEERTNRTVRETEFESDTLEMLELVDYYEAHVNIDWDNDGIAERRKICAIGGGGSSVEIVENERDDFHGMCTLSTVPQPHRHEGISLADSGKWIQRVSSVLTRQLLDNLYRTNRPRQFAGPGVNLEQLESYVPHGVVEVQNVDSVREEVIQTVVDKVLPVLKHFDEEKEAGSGVSRHTMGLDAERLQDTTMGAYVNALGQASQRLEMIARTFAETGFAELAKALHYLVRTHQDIDKMQRIAGEWVEIDPATWRDERDVAACVGLGYGTSQERVAAGMALLDVQKEAVPAGLSTKTHIYRNLEDVVRAMGKRDPSMYFLDPASEEGQRVAQELEQRAESEKQEAKQEQRQVFDTLAAEEAKKTTLDLAKLRAQIEKDTQKHYEALAKLELEYGVDIAGKGIEPGDMQRTN